MKAIFFILTFCFTLVWAQEINKPNCDCSNLFFKDGITYCDSTMKKKADGIFECQVLANDKTYWTKGEYHSGLRVGSHQTSTAQGFFSDVPGSYYIQEKSYQKIIKKECNVHVVEIENIWLAQIVEISIYNCPNEIPQNTLDYLKINVFEPLLKKYEAQKLVFLAYFKDEPIQKVIFNKNLD